MNMEHLRCYSSAAEIGAEGELVTPFRQKTRFAPNYALCWGQIAKSVTFPAGNVDRRIRVPPADRRAAPSPTRR
jgi:hypothetical protein